MTDQSSIKLPEASRRRFLQGAGATSLGLVVGFHWLPRTALAQAKAAGEPQMMNAFIRIAPDNTVTVLSKHLEMGQGVYTGLSTIVAEELDADWSQMRAEGAPADAKTYANLAFGMQGTGGSTAIANSYDQLRKAGATARAMLVAAAAEQWKVPAQDITVSKGVVSHAGSGRKASFGQLAAKAATMTPPAEVPLKDPAKFVYIGKKVARIDSRAKGNGTAQYTIDVKLPGMLTALLQRAPQFGATVKSFDAGKAKAVPGVVDVVQISNGVAVVAKNFWSAKLGREALTVEWDDAAAEKRGSDQILAEYKELAKKPGLPARKEGNVDEAFAKAAKIIEASYDFPYLAHAPMEPLDVVVKLDTQGADIRGCEIWAGDQFQTPDQMNAARVLGLKPEQVKINTLFAGGSFGRRATTMSDYIVEGAEIAKAIGAKEGTRGAPVKLMWTREDDIQGGRYRPMYHHVLKAGVDAQGNITAWQHRIVGQSIIAGTPFEQVMVKDGIDATSVEGAANLPYAIPNMSVELHTTRTGVTVLWWRSVGSTHTAFATEVFLDEIAAATGQDPVALRRKLLTRHPRHLGVLNLAAEKAGWGKPLPAGRLRGIAVHESFSSYVAEVAEVSLKPDGSWKVEKIVAAVDCGQPINPDIIRAQVESGIGFGLSATIKPGISLSNGTVEQSNFHDYEVLRIHEMPQVEVHIVPSREKPTGIGEPGTPPVAPAVANALMSGTKQVYRALPLPATATKSA
ncbi:MAG: xanthine dehydrogenase family protein molybdopterin-binding subunit [Ferrovibrio sp.]|uniref:xanthine dehydrogenase family protein molybdopterin-binding subunit n=1 Tax=Ferrovibrio sp. TaxID=1917215 RepID=UPI00262529D7|nr:xanthine dehydrogenase family protein molybdopterin-binding subunit [Ferrovibrio sp.]MCW0236534.1 xanthine dehydrogenase family protein molybdopterin-binding subunit [Ferrovibrio sp.]